MLQAPIVISKKSGPMWFAIFFGLIWCAIAAFGFIIGFNDIIYHGKFGPVLLLLILLIVGFGFVYYGLSRIKKTTITINNSNVIFRKSGLVFKKVEWTEPLKFFSGIMTKSFMRYVNHNPYIIYNVVLEHPESDKTIVLETYADGGQQRTRAEFFSRELSLPFLVETASGEILERKPEEVDENIEKQIQHGKLKRTFASRSPFPEKKYQLINTEEGFTFRRTYRIWLLLAFALCVIGCYVFLQKPSGIVMLFFMFAFWISVIGFGVETITVEKDMITHRLRIAGIYDLKFTLIPLNKIQEIIIANDYSMGKIASMNQAVKVASNSKVFYFGHYAGAETREWMADKLIEFVSKNNS